MIDMVKKRYEELKKKHPQVADEIMLKYITEEPEMASATLDKYEYGCHIMSNDMYNKGMALLRWADGHNGSKWEVDTIKALCGIKFDEENFSDEDFSLLDFCAEVNTLWSDYCLIITDPSIYFKMAKQNLTDCDYPGDPTERAYKMLVKRMEDEDKV